MAVARDWGGPNPPPPPATPPFICPPAPPPEPVDSQELASAKAEYFWLRHTLACLPPEASPSLRGVLEYTLEEAENRVTELAPLEQRITQADRSLGEAVLRFAAAEERMTAARQGLRMEDVKEKPPEQVGR